MTTYERLKPATAGPVTNTYLELKMLCLFYFVLESELQWYLQSGLQWYLKNDSIFPYFILFLFQFQMSIFISQFINVIAPHNDLLMDELNVIYFTTKWWLYVMIWLPRTTDNSTYFAQSLEIRGIESRLYMSSLTLFLLGNFECLFCCLQFFFNTNFFQTPSERQSNSLTLCQA